MKLSPDIFFHHPKDQGSSRDLFNVKVVLITGCDSGIGHELARHLDSLGFHVFAGCLDTGSEGAQRLRIESSPFLRLVNMDVTKEDHVKHAIHYITENLPAGESGLYALINNAGICICGEFEWQTWSQLENQVNVNLLGALRVTKHCLPLLKAGQGRILNVSSVAGLYGYPGLSAYCATKHAIEGMSTVIREELAKFNVNVITIQPGDFSKATHLLDNHHRNMNEMWGEMSDASREEYKEYFITYHNGVAKSGMTRKKMKPMSYLPDSLMRGFENALLTKVPDDNYLLLPTLYSQIKMITLSLLPLRLSQYLVSRRYRHSLPPVNNNPYLLRESVRSSSCSVISYDTASTKSYGSTISVSSLHTSSSIRL
ncbi:E1.1.1.30 [Lepeophtheirus salmonis]|uniref:E1.1.1.30 n=1 Tax=Lepeophtheirus salmonis TaxID=72036 RepID=A0A7R8D2G2_LEPSM|nr:E1.1.1.30 [Lepeophtheirus salmonis]CAF3005218.1 E1.1.1.30 [Lepeophtheirus salmonis]